MTIDKGKVRTAGVLIILLLFSLLLPTAAVTVDDVKDGLISRDHARDLAQAALLESALSGNLEPDAESWDEVSLHPEPIVIYDLNGEPLFYHFDVVDDNGFIGSIKIGASSVLPSPVMTVGFGPRYWDPKEPNQEAGEYLSRECPGYTLVSTQPVCYSYPKIGYRIDFHKPNDTASYELIIDAATGESIGRERAWSYYDTVSISNLVKNRDQWTYEELIHTRVLNEASDFGIDGTRSGTKETVKALGESLARLAQYQSWIDERFNSSKSTTQTAKGGSHYLGLTLHPQEKNYYCTVATIQMIAEYYGFSYSQDSIAQSTNTYSSGTTTSNEISFFKNFLNKKGTFSDSTPSFWEEKSELIEGRPFDSSVSYPGGQVHARACAGYHDDFGTMKLRIYDPWPPNVGEIYDESFTEVVHYEDVFVCDSGQQTPTPTMTTTTPTPSPTPAPIDITSRSIQGRFTSSSQQAYYYFDIPAGVSSCTVSLTGLGSRNFNLYIKKGTDPSLSSYDYASTGQTSIETIRLENPLPGRYHVMVHAYSGYGAYMIRESHTSTRPTTVITTIPVTATCTPTPSPTPGVTDITSRSVQGRFTSTGQQAYYYFDIPAGIKSCTVTLTGISSRNFNFYVKFGSNPTLSSFDYAKTDRTISKSIVIRNPAPGRYHVMIHAYSGYGTFTIREMHR